MEYTFEQYQESADALKRRLGSFRPRCLLILGSGLGSLGEEVESPIFVPYGEVPHMKRSTAPDHAGRFVFGRLAGQDAAVMQGRLHTYEGWSFEDVSYPVRVLRLLGAETLVVTNAAGAVSTAFSAGDIMLITDHIKLFGVSPLCGPNLEEFGPRFPDMSHVYTPRLRDAARQAAAEHPESLLAGAEEITGKTVFDAADRGDETANAVVDRFCDYLGAGVTNIVNALAPEVILIGGGISRQGERLLAPIRRYVAANCFGGTERPQPVIQTAQLGNEAGIIGAAAL